MEATQVKTEEAVQAPGKKEPPKLKVPKKKKKWLKRLIIAVVVLAAIFLIFIRPMMSAGQQFVAGTYLPETAQRQDLRISVSSTGTITPIDSYKVSALVNGEIVEAPFEEGDWVEKGALLYRFDAEDAQNAVQQAQLSVAQAELGYRTAQESVNPYSTASGIVQKLYVSVGDPVAVGDPIADVGDNTTMTVEIPFHSADAAGLYVGQTGTLTIEGTMETVTGTIESISGADEVGAGGALIRQVKFRVSNPGGLTGTTAATAVVGSVACAGSGTFSQSTGQTVVAQTAGEITALHVTSGSPVSYGTVLATIGGTAAETTLENARIGVENAKLALDSRLQALENYEITAPISGTVIEKNFKAGDNVDSSAVTSAGGNLAVLYDMSTLTFEMKVNELDINNIQVGQEVAVLYDMSTLTFEMKVNELDINNIQVGQEVEITADALEGMTFKGYVDKININGTTANGRTTYPVTVVVEGTPEELKPGMNVSAEVLVEDAGNVLCVPVEAVQRGNTVLVAGQGALDESGNLVDPAKLEERPVTLGRSSSEYIEILDGLEG